MAEPPSPPSLPAWAGAWERAESALARLDERLRNHPVREGWLARAAVAEASASAALEAVWVDADRIALWESDAADSPADPGLALGYGIVRAARALARTPPAEALTVDGILDLHARLIGAAPRSAPRALSAWHRLAPLRHGEAAGRLLSAAYLWQRRKTLAPFAPIARGFREMLADYRPFDPPDRWLPLFLDAMARGADQGLKDLAALGLARERLLARCQGHRRHSRLGKLAEFLLDRPAASSGDVARALGITRRGAMMLLEELAAGGAIEEVSGRERFRVYRAAR